VAGESKPEGGFVFTSNVDGHFERAGFDPQRIVECHGSLVHLQCTSPCSDRIWEAADLAVEVDQETMRARPPLPACPACGALARPNVLMFGDWGWLSSRTEAQHERMAVWWSALPTEAEVVIVELGAGSAVPTVRLTSEPLATRNHTTLLRINPREPEVPAGQVGIAAGALATLAGIDELLAG
jgi:NAD-dependent SIR2 family protein deacetylase